MKIIPSIALAFGLGSVAIGTASLAQTTLFGDHYMTGDLSVDGTLCAGLECTNTENFFGLFTMKLKDTRPSIRFEDTSSSASADRDWALAASGSAATEEFLLSDLTAATQPLRVIGGAPTNSLFIDADGGVGLGTMFPEFNLHMVSPAVALATFETTTTPQKWYVGANSAGFFVQDSIDFTVPMIIEDGAPTHSLRVVENGNIGLGTQAPTDALHIKRNDGTAVFRVEDTGASTGNLTMMHLVNASGRARMQFSSSGGVNQTGDWSISSGKTFVLQDRSDGQNVLIVDQDGNVDITGQLTTAGSCSIGCDRVFDDDYDLLSLDEHATAMWQNGYLPNVGPTPEDGTFNVSDKMGRMLNELEHAHIYIDQLHDQLKDTKVQHADQIAQHADQIAALTARLATLETQ